MNVPVVLTIAGSDSGAGAGIQADLKTFAALGVYGVSVLTAVTAQNTVKVSAVQELDLDMIRAQLDAVAEDFQVAALKTGMLSSAQIIECVVDGIQKHGLRPLVVDPVMVAKSNARLLREDAVDALREKLIPLAEVVTPNLPEAEVLWGRPIRSREDRVLAGRAILDLGARAVVVKGGHSDADPVVDLLVSERGVQEFSAPRVNTSNTHGTGCTFSAAIAAGLASGLQIGAAVDQARQYLTATLTGAPAIGHGHGPLNHFPGRPGWATDRRTAHVLH
jgi:hydroxymethylpyrimidine/phosphomethylpyrimidine kinase